MHAPLLSPGVGDRIRYRTPLLQVGTPRSRWGKEKGGRSEVEVGGSPCTEGPDNNPDDPDPDKAEPGLVMDLTSRPMGHLLFSA